MVAQMMERMMILMMAWTTKEEKHSLTIINGIYDIFLEILSMISNFSLQVSMMNDDNLIELLVLLLCYFKYWIMNI